MHIHLACSIPEIITFTRRELADSFIADVQLTSAETLSDIPGTLHSAPEHGLADMSGMSMLLLDLDCPDTAAILTKLDQPPLNRLPVAVLASSKHPIPGEPTLPERAVRIRKPFCLAALEQAGLLAWRALQLMPAEVLEAGDVQLHPATGAAFRNNAPLRPHPREALLLEAFMRRAGELISRDFILEHFFDYTAHLRPNLVDVLACRLRNRLHAGFDSPVLHTVRGEGYVFAP